jgi:hypothetical protein
MQAKARIKRAQERIALGVKKLKLKPVAPKPKPIKYCRHYLKGRCHEGDKCKFSHDTIPETKCSVRLLFQEITYFLKFK